MRIPLYLFIFVVSVMLAFVANYLLYHAPISWYYDYGEMPSAGQLEIYENEKHLNRLFCPKNSIMGFVCGLVFCLISVILFEQNDRFMTAHIMVLLLPILYLLSASDCKYKILPDQYLLSLLIAVIIYFAGVFFDAKTVQTAQFAQWDMLISMFIGALVGGGFFLLFGIIGGAIYKIPVIGMGDVKLCGILGLFLGIKSTVALLLITIVLAGIYAVVMLILNRIKKSDYLPLCPFIAVSFILTVVFEKQITAGIDIYMSIFHK